MRLLLSLSLSLVPHGQGASRLGAKAGQTHGQRRVARAAHVHMGGTAGSDDAEKERLEAGRRRMEEIFAQNVTIDTSASAVSATQRLLQQLFPSSQFVGTANLPSKFIFVDELTCIGCTHCKYVAPKTFMLEDDFGRARVFVQGGDTQEKIDEAIECCPVECIHQVSHTELVRLESFRADKGEVLQGKFWKSRYVGSELGNPRVPNWWEPLLDSAQPAWAAMLSGPTSLSALGFLGPAPPTEPVELDMWGNPLEAQAQTEVSSITGPMRSELCEVEPLEVCDLVNCGDLTTAELAAQLERALLADGAELCDLLDCADIPRTCAEVDDEAIEIETQADFNP